MELPEGVKVTVGGRTFKGEITGQISPALRKLVQSAIDKAAGKPEPKKQAPKQEQVDKP